ncbi:PIG-L deacetylase family protein [Kineosporia sp. A_224]|uniref:PIG-L deacetylase family protein n=1 Tax=Kineosporia sp. A_224 TaxID=1962180 RepID=UPI000B4B63D9|nr:PIG-L deacetylase family protein [Kineosporia sp. A_224]
MSAAHETRSAATDADPSPTAALPGWRRPLVVVAHPDDESFGLGAVLSAFVGAGASVAVLCFTHGEASTLHGVEGDLRELRAGELAEAARRLGLAGVELLDEPDGALGAAGSERLVTAVLRALDRHGADGFVVFDDTGITGHPDHVAATAAAVTAARGAGLPVLAWTLPEPVAQALRDEFGAPFAGRPKAEVDLVLTVDRAAQLEAVAAHPSQAVPGSVLWRRLDLLGPVEHLRWLHRPA